MLQKKVRLRKLVNRRDHLQRVLTTMANDVDFDIHCKDCTIDVYGCFEQRFGRPPRKKDFIPFMCENCEKKGRGEALCAQLSHGGTEL